VSAKAKEPAVSDNTVSVIIGAYASVEEANTDLDYILEEREEQYASTFDAAIVAKDEDGKVRIDRRYETPISIGAWGGLVVGAFLGLIYPPILLELGAVGAATGAIVGHLWKGMSRGDVKELGESLDESSAALVVAVESSMADRARGHMGRATSITVKEVAARASDIDSAISGTAGA
jgi:uncharacterized membrane protein